MSVSKDQIQQAICKGVTRYFDDCRERVPGFVANQFNYPGAWHTNKHAIGWDMLKAPINLFWAPIYLLLCVLAFVIRKFGWAELSHRLSLLPSGFSTSVQQALTEQVVTQILQQSRTDSPPQKLQAFVVDELELLARGQGWRPEQLPALEDALQPVVSDALKQYGITRTASADITNALLSTVVGAFAFQKYTPGGLAIGFSVAAIMANALAAKEFVLGEQLGTLYYDLFPATPSFAVTFASMAAVLGLMATFASLSGVITDPIQSALGLHQRRLNKMLTHLETDLAKTVQQEACRAGNGTFRPKDQYLARLMDVIDATRSHLH